MTGIAGVQHVALMTADIKRQIEFFTDVLGCRLVALFDMQGVPGGVAAFVAMDDGAHVSLIQTPEVEGIARQIGVTHAGSGSGVSAGGTMQHLALAVPSREALLAMRDRIRSRGINVIGPVSDGMSLSLYLAGYEHIALKIVWAAKPIDPDRWIDPEVASRLGIAAADTGRFRSPARYDGEGGAVPQPAYDPAKPHVALPEVLYRQILEASDDVVLAISSYTEPPVPQGSGS